MWKMIVIIIVHNLITSFPRWMSLETGFLMHARMHFHQHLIQHLLHLSLLKQFCFHLFFKTQTKDNDVSSMTDTTIMMMVMRWIVNAILFPARKYHNTFDDFSTSMYTLKKLRKECVFQFLVQRYLL